MSLVENGLKSLTNVEVECEAAIMVFSLGKIAKGHGVSPRLNILSLETPCQHTQNHAAEEHCPEHENVRSDTLHSLPRPPCLPPSLSGREDSNA